MTEREGYQKFFEDVVMPFGDYLHDRLRLPNNSIEVLMIPLGTFGFLVDITEARYKKWVLAQRVTHRPPINAQYLFYLFLNPENCDALVGDLEERYRLMCKTFGVSRADFWFLTQALRSVAPIAWAWVKKTALKPLISVIGWAVARGIVILSSWLATLVACWLNSEGWGLLLATWPRFPG